MATFVRSASEWQDRLDTARGSGDVIETCQDFVASFAPSMLAQLPRACLPPLNLDPATLSSYAVELVRHQLDQGENASPVLTTFAHFFTDAAQAIARIAMARRRPDLFSSQVRRR
jgi:hypothetical protein